MSQRILIVEDNPMLAAALNYKLLKEGFLVDVCRDGTSAIIKIGQENYDMILIDLVLPFTSGLKVIKWAKTEYPVLPIIVLSSVYEEHIITRTFLMGVADFISKPFDPAELSASIKKHLSISY
ncbi:response regulator transcription factor [Leeuwenhoekiella sp. NPDC079379]|uniref:response regulator transcription factor n=1 Tax=Leeuwenhoekiella sp. NPDC079379 TaxID=3364122 RepID=UPI0037C5FB8D